MLHRNILNNMNAIDQNKPTTTPTISECAALSLDVYYKLSDSKRPILPNGWTRFMDSGDQDNGYFGACYIKNPEKPSCVIFAHRGTVLNELGTIISNIEAALNKFILRAPLQFRSAAKFVIEAEIAITNTYPDLDFDTVNGIHTGHSLGGILAELMATGETISAITFENPGSKPIILKILRDSHFPEKLIQEKLKQLYKMCLAYQADVNLINTFNEQVGQTFRLVNLPYKYDIYEQGPNRTIPAKAIQNLYYFLGYTMNDQHKLENICQYLQNNNAIVNDRNPAGVQEGYIAYLDVKNRLDYWQGYFKFIWDRNSEIRERYQNRLELYLAECYKTVKVAQEAAKKSELVNRSQNLEGKASQAGLFKRKNSAVDINDFILVDRDSSFDSQENYKKSKCSIM